MEKNYDNWFKEANYNGVTFWVNATGTVVRHNDKYLRIHTPTYSHAKSPRTIVHFKQKVYSVARMVAIAFVPNPKKLPLAVHIDQVSTNNFYKNLKWGDSSTIQKRRFILNMPREGKHCDKLTKKQKLEIAKRLRSGSYAKDLAVEYGVSHATITRVRKRTMKDKHGNKRYDTEVKQLVHHPLNNGFTASKIASGIGIRYETVWKWSKLTEEELNDRPCGHIKIKNLHITDLDIYEAIEYKKIVDK